MKKTQLGTPGPTEIPERVRVKLALPIIHHRTPEYEKILAKVRDQLKWFFGTKQEVITICSSGTGGMEASVTNFFSRGDKVLCIDGGKFGERWTNLSKTFELNPKVLKVEWGYSALVKDVQKELDADPSIKGVFLQASETSTGVSHPYLEIAELVSKRDNTLCVVDGITAVGIEKIDFDSSKIDVLVAGSQKALMLPPGLALLAISEKAWRFNKTATLPRYYFDLAKELKNLLKNTSAYTPAISFIIGLNESLTMMEEEGREQVFDRHRRMALATRAGAESLGLSLYPNGIPALCLTAVLPPDGMSADTITKGIYNDFGIKLGGGQDELKGKIFRIGHMGYYDQFYIASVFTALEQTLRKLGYTKFESGVSLKRSMEVYHA